MMYGNTSMMEFDIIIHAISNDIVMNNTDDLGTWCILITALMCCFSHILSCIVSLQIVYIWSCVHRIVIVPLREGFLTFMIALLWRTMFFADMLYGNIIIHMECSSIRQEIKPLLIGKHNITLLTFYLYKIIIPKDVVI
jgi:hypothetical protein